MGALSSAAPMPAVQAINDRTSAALGAEAVRMCAARVAKVTGTHALLLDGMAHIRLGTPEGVACVTTLRRAPEGADWRGSLRAEPVELPFGDGAFCLVCAYFPGLGGVLPEPLAGELARVLSVHGTLLVVDVHPVALWHAPSSSPWRWQRALRGAGLQVAAAVRFGSPWPRARGTDGLPRWMVQLLGGGWLLAARRRPEAGATVLRPAFAGRRVREPATLLPGAGAHRQRA
ncbi:MAG TPA: hypothetical protein VFQ95_10045 [Rhodanobacteraceae bacterium]|nr:hypothetical protein [Rhodanobacteraceae bacterium]